MRWLPGCELGDCVRHGGLAGGQEWQHGRCAARAGDGREDESEALEGTQMVLTLY